MIFEKKGKQRCDVCAGTIAKLANDVIGNKLGGFMVWYASVLDGATGKPALVGIAATLSISAIHAKDPFLLLLLPVAVFM